MWSTPYNYDSHNSRNLPAQETPAQHIHEQIMAGNNTSSPFNDLKGMAPQGLDPFDDSRNKHVVDNNIHTHRSEKQPGATPTKMAGLPKNDATPKADLDPRVAAAELKKKLLKDKNIRAIRDKSLGPLGEVSHNTIRPDKRSFSDTATTSTFVPHAPPQIPSQNSVDADAEDIAALIKSISSATQGSKVKTTGNATDPKHCGLSVVRAVANTGASSSENLRNETIPGLGSVAQAPSGRSTQGTPFHVPLEVKGGEAAARRTPPGVVKTPARSSSIQVRDTRAEASKTTHIRTATSTPSELEATATTSNAKPPLPSASVRLQDKKQQGGAVLGDAACSIASWDAHSPSSNFGRLSEAKKGKVVTPLEQPTVTGKVGDGNNGRDTQTVGATLAKLIAEDQDLRDWLVYTQYHDVEARNKKLTRYRALAEMEAAELRIKEEQERLAAARRKLLEEDELDQSLLLPITRIGHSLTPQPFIPATPTTTVPSAHPANDSSKDDTTPTTSVAQKRRLDVDETHEQRAKIPKLDIEVAKDSKASNAEDVDPRIDRERGRDSDRDHSDYRRRSLSFHRGGSQHRRSPSRGPYKKYDKYSDNYRDDYYDRRNSYQHDTGRYDAYRGKPKRGGWARTPSPYGRYGRLPAIDPKPVDLGGKGDTRFFVVKSFNDENVITCMDDGLWMTQAQNTETLTSAFAQCKNVILFFSVNKSGAFQGYARMATAPSPDTPRPRWIKSLQWDSSPPFRIEWLSTTEIEFGHVRHLRNSLNNDLPVLVGKDGQEIEEECGRKLLEQMERVARSRNGAHGPPESPRADRGRGGFNIRGRGGKYVKEER